MALTLDMSPNAKPDALSPGPALYRPTPLDDDLDVLYVDDDPVWTGLVGGWLKRRGLRGLCIGSFEELRAHLAGGSGLPRCLLLDLALRDARGFFVCDLLKKSPAFQAIPIVVLTGTEASTRECLRHGAVYRLAKDPGLESELFLVLDAILSQQERTRGVVDAGDLRLDPHRGRVFHRGLLIAGLTPGYFSAFMRLVQASPDPLSDGKLYESFIERRTYHKIDDPITVRQAVRNHLCSLRRDLGAFVGSRLVRVKEAGYAYCPPEPIARL